MQLLQPTPFWNFLLDQTGFKKQNHPFTRFQWCFFTIWILILLILLILKFLKESLGLIWVKLQNSWFDSKISISSIYGARFSFIWVWRKFWANLGKNHRMIYCIINRFEYFHFGAHFTNFSVPFCSFWI